MITNERQYKITRSEAERFRKTIADLEQGTEREGIHPRLLQAEREAMDSQLSDLQAELSEYERLKSAKLAVIEINTFDGLAEGLIKARIAAGLSQKALAERLNLKEQQVQRYEAERYGSASFQRLREVASAIGVRIKNEILLPVSPSNFDGVVNKLRQVGIDREFLLSRLLTSADAARATGEVPIEDDSALSAKTGSVLERIYGWTRKVCLARTHWPPLGLLPPRRGSKCPLDARKSLPRCIQHMPIIWLLLCSRPVLIFQ